MKHWRYVAFFLICYSVGLIIGLGLFSKIQAAAEPFLWGVNMSAFGLNDLDDPYQPANVDKQLALLKELGVNSVRLNLEVDKNSWPARPRDETNDDVINRLTKAGLKILLIVEDPWPGDSLFKLDKQLMSPQSIRQAGWAWGYKTASRYPGKIYAYQLANEVSGMIVKDNHSGRLISDYDEGKYQLLKEWLIGLSKGIRDGDPHAKRVITAHWVATAIIDQLIADQVPFEVIGWNWFSDMGEDPIHKTLADGTILDVVGHFASRGKQFWFTELNRSHGSAGSSGELAQSSYLKKAVSNIKRSSAVSGIFVYTLVDDPVGELAQDRNWGLVKVVKGPSGRLTIGEPKLAFESFSEIIKIDNQF